MKWICSECGTDNVSSKAWANPNTDEIEDYVSGEEEDNWCEDCNDHRRLVTLEDDEEIVLCPNCKTLTTKEEGESETYYTCFGCDAVRDSGGGWTGL